MEHLVANMGQVRRVNDSRGSWLVAPMTLIVPGVLDGSRGPLYYPADEIARNAAEWDGFPLTRNHPVDNAGRPISASSEGVVDRVGLGEVRNPKIIGNTLKAEGWFHETQTKRVDPAIWRAVENGETIELSTGLGTENTIQNGECPVTKRRYTAIARNYKPDHVAVLTDGQRGACSIDDGCGVNNAFCPTGDGGGVDPSCGSGDGGDQDLVFGFDDGHQEYQQTVLVKPKEAKLKQQLKELADGSSMWQAKGIVTTDGKFYAWLKPPEGKGPKTGMPVHESIADSIGIPEGQWMALKFRYDHDSDSIIGRAERGYATSQHQAKIERHIDKLPYYVRVDNKGKTMNRDQATTYLTANCDCWKNKREVLANKQLFTDEEVVRLADKHKASTLAVNSLRQISKTVGAPKTLTINEMPAFIKDKMDEKEAAPKEKKTCPECEGKGEDCECDEPAAEEPVVPTGNRKSTAQWLAEAPAEARELLTNAINDSKAAKADLIDKIVANSKPEVATRLRKIYASHSINELKDILGATVANSKKNGTSSDPLTNYFGAGGGSDYVENEESELDEGVEYVGEWAGR